VIWADGMSYVQRWAFWTFDIVQCFAIALHRCIIRFHTLYDVSYKCLEMIMMMFKLTWRKWSRLRHVYACCISRGIIKTLFKREWRFWYRFVPNLLEYIRAPKIQNRARSDKVTAKNKMVQFFDAQWIITKQDRQTNRQTDRTKIIYHVTLRVVSYNKLSLHRIISIKI